MNILKWVTGRRPQPTASGAAAPDLSGGMLTSLIEISISERSHVRAANPALSNRQVEGILRLAKQWGDKLVALREQQRYWRQHRASTAYGGQYLHWQRLNVTVAEKEFRTLLEDQTLDWEEDSILDDEQKAEVVELARRWALWRWRAAEPQRYGPCIEPIYQAHWQLVDYLLALEAVPKQKLSGAVIT